MSQPNFLDENKRQILLHLVLERESKIPSFDGYRIEKVTLGGATFSLFMRKDLVAQVQVAIRPTINPESYRFRFVDPPLGEPVNTVVYGRIDLRSEHFQRLAAEWQRRGRMTQYYTRFTDLGDASVDATPLLAEQKICPPRRRRAQQIAA